MRLAIQSSNSHVLSNGVEIRIEEWTVNNKKSDSDFWAVKVVSTGGDVVSIERFSSMRAAYMVYRGYKRNLAH